MARVAGDRRAVFLDRDGTLNVEKNYLYKVADWEWEVGALEAVRQINDRGWLTIIVTNQPGIARGLYREEDVRTLHRYVDGLLIAAGAKIDAYYICPHHPDFGADCQCHCRKPAPGMLLRAAKDFSINLQQSFMVGDKASDVEAARGAGVTPILVATGYGATETHGVSQDVWRASNVLEAIEKIWKRIS
jgi:D-glycero-D-manno-heptose 1,7-bisphosphate phosphatase